MCNLYKGSSSDGMLLSSYVFTWKKYPDRRADAVSRIIYFCVYIKSVTSRQTRHMIMTT